MPDAAKKIRRRLDALGRLSDEPGRLTRLFASPALRQANDLVALWMREAGMVPREDAIGNLIGHYPGTNPRAKILLLGSHLDTVRDAGKFDGPLGVVLAIACVERLHRSGRRLPFAIEVLALADEEGVRYQTAYLGSKVLTGQFNQADLRRTDSNQVSMAEAIRLFGGRPAQLGKVRLNPDRLLGYVEVHIEQGPVLENLGLPLGVVSSIAGQTRLKVSFVGRAGHAGTTPMGLRRDALCAAAEFILALETLARKTSGLVATVGQVEVAPNASNVIPGRVEVTVDLRHSRDSVRRRALNRLQKIKAAVHSRRAVRISWQVVQQTNSVACSRALSALLRRAAQKYQKDVPSLPSGAGHDAALLARITPAAMLFVRCAGGVSHHPDESVATRDIAAALQTMNQFLDLAAEGVPA